jgi:ATP-dependent Clp endopeptidase proteolytic subunit ClpP
MKRQFQVFNFSIHNSTEDVAEINIDGAIVDAETQAFFREWYGDDTSVSFKSFRDQIKSLNAKTYNIYVNSPGGLVTDAMAMHDLIVDMRNQGKQVNTIGRGIIASAATYILMAGNSSMSENSWFMIHNVSGYAWGDVNQVEQMAVTLRKFNDAARDFYAKATGKRKEDITKMMDAETWMTAEEAKQHGFVSSVSGKVNFTNAISREHWQFSNTAVLNAYNSACEKAPYNSVIQNQIDEMKKFFQDMGTNILNAIKGIKAPENNDHAALMNSIGEAVGSKITEAADQVDNAVAEAVTNAVAQEVKNIDQKVADAVANAIKPLNQKITDLEKVNKELEKDLEELIGNKTGSGQSENSAKPKVNATIKMAK